MTDTNMTDTNIPHSGGGVPQDCGKHVRVITTRRNDEGQKACCRWWCVVSCLLCSVWHNTSCVGCVGGDSRRVTPGFSFSNPVAKSVGADGTAPGRVWESRLLPALITPDGGWGVCVPVWHRHPTHPFFLLRGGFGNFFDTNQSSGDTC